MQISLGAAPKRSAAPKKEAAPKAEAAATPAGLPPGYAELTVAQIKHAAPTWTAAELEAALAWETEHAARKGAIAALESSLPEREEQ